MTTPPAPATPSPSSYLLLSLLFTKASALDFHFYPFLSFPSNLFSQPSIGELATLSPKAQHNSAVLLSASAIIVPLSSCAVSPSVTTDSLCFLLAQSKSAVVVFAFPCHTKLESTKTQRRILNRIGILAYILLNREYTASFNIGELSASMC